MFPLPRSESAPAACTLLPRERAASPLFRCARALLASLSLCSALPAAPLTPPSAPPAAVSPLSLDALEADPGDGGAWRRAADILERAGDPRAVALRRAVLASEPESIGNRFALIHTALRFGDVATAEHLVDDLPAFAPSSVETRLAAAAVAFVNGHPDQAGEILADPRADATDQLNVSILELRHGNARIAADARPTLRLHLNTPAYARMVTRELVEDALRNRDAKTALQLSRALAARTEATLDDHLLFADVQLQLQTQTLSAVQATLSARALTSAGDAAGFAHWLIARADAATARAWLANLPEALRATPEILAARADVFVALRDWPAARPLIAAGAWGPLSADVLQRAEAARALSSAEARRSAWDALIRTSAADVATLRTLHRLAVSWKLAPEREAVLSAIVKAQPGNGLVFQALADLALLEKNTPKLAGIYTRWHAAAPENITVESHRLLLAVLTSSKPSAELRAEIERLAMFNPEQPLLATARALVLWQLGRTGEALAVTDSIRTADRRWLARALYHGVFVATAGGRNEEALAYLALSEKAPLLPEETALLQTARATLGQISAK